MCQTAYPPKTQSLMSAAAEFPIFHRPLFGKAGSNETDREFTAVISSKRDLIDYKRRRVLMSFLGARPKRNNGGRRKSRVDARLRELIRLLVLPEERLLTKVYEKLNAPTKGPSARQHVRLSLTRASLRPGPLSSHGVRLRDDSHCQVLASVQPS